MAAAVQRPGKREEGCSVEAQSGLSEDVGHVARGEELQAGQKGISHKIAEENSPGRVPFVICCIAFTLFD